MADATIDAHAMLDDWVLFTLLDGGRFVVGIVSCDRKGRFQDGACMGTSLLRTPMEGIVEGAIVETENSRYLLGRRETDPDRVHALVAGYMRHELARRDQ